MPTVWEEPPGSEPRIAANAQALMWEIARDADLREPPTVASAQRWHRKLYDGIPRPSAAMVPAALSQFETSAKNVCTGLDAELAVGAKLGDIRPVQLHGVLTFCAFLHGEWVRIHPFANGNGRTARVWANWAAMRYGLPPFVIVKPRPGQPYGAAAMASMRKDHRVTMAVFNRMLRDYVSKLE
jgi:hypothetical protein